MLSFLRLPFFPLQRDENSRNPALTGDAMLISPILFIISGPRLLVARCTSRRRGRRVAFAERLALERSGFVTELSFSWLAGALRPEPPVGAKR